MRYFRFPHWPACLTIGVAVMVATTATAENPKPGKEEVMAVVNAEPITRKQLASEAIRRYGDDVLDSLINRHLILQACESQGIKVTNQEVQDEVVRIAGKFNLSPEYYLKMLEDGRDIRADQYAREVVWPMLALRRLVAGQTEVTSEEFNRAFVSQFGEAIKCRMIMVSSQQKAAQLRQRALAAPDEFGPLAKEHSEDEASASVRGLIPPLRRHMGDPQLEEAAFALQKDEISEVLQMGDQWIILQCVSRLPATPPAPKALPAIREQINDQIRDEKIRVAAADLFRNLQQQAQLVKVLGSPELTAQHPGVAALINNKPVTLAQLGDECIKRHGKEVLVGEINRKMLTQALRRAKQEVTQADLDEEVRRAAVNYGFVKSDGTADINGWLREVTGQQDAPLDLYVRDAVWPSVALKKLVDADIEVTEDDLRRGFESNFGPRAEVLAIVLSDQRTAQKVWDMARSNPTDQFFGELAGQYSIEPVSQSNLGKVPPIRRYGGQPAIEQEAFALKAGELSGIIATGDKYIILRSQGRTQPVVNDFEAVREELTRDLSERKTRLAMAEKFDELKSAAQIDNFLDGTSQSGRVAAGAPAAPQR